MPELPEVETICSFIDKKITSKKIVNVFTINSTQLHGDIDHVLNEKVTEVYRKGKVLVFILSNKYCLSIHLKMSGQVLYADNFNKAIYENIIPFSNSKQMPASTTRIVIKFHDNSAVFYNDLRRFGWIKITPEPHVPVGVDVYSDQFTLDKLESLLQKSRKKVLKTLLMEQDKLAGIGNIYANDALFTAGILPTRLSGSLTKHEIKNLYTAIKKVIAEGIKKKGSSSKDEVYILPDGSSGSYQNHFKVYAQEGKPCSKCKKTILRIKQGGRSSFYCNKCQR
jgi:formamidopyrimidine-DNA glycosylase